ncbi:hypothetical protein Tco_1402220 [Tanacetum coccineum]
MVSFRSKEDDVAKNIHANIAVGGQGSSGIRMNEEQNKLANQRNDEGPKYIQELTVGSWFTKVDGEDNGCSDALNFLKSDA